MDLILYKNTSPDNSINKVLTDAETININLRRVSDLTALELVLEGGQGLDLTLYNYAHISNLNRYYFITSLENLGGSLWRVSLEVDVLETYKVDILNSEISYNRAVKTGDKADVALNSLTTKTINKVESDFSLSGENQLVITTIGEGKYEGK